MSKTTKEFQLTLQGFFREYMEAALPAQSGIYFVFGGVVKAKGKCQISRLIYIGESNDIANRLSNHEKRPTFQEALGQDEILYYAYTLVSTSERELCEKGLIKHFSDRFGRGLINILSTTSFMTDYKELHYVLLGSVPHLFTGSDRDFRIYPNG